MIHKAGEGEFGGVALRLYERQRLLNPIYARFCERSGVGTVRRWRDIPALPVSAFKYHRVACFPPSQTRRVFMTSGTTQAGLRGKHEFKTLRHYDTAVRDHFKDCVLPDLKSDEKISVVFLVERPAERPESSLCHMGGRVLKYFGSARPFYALKHGRADWLGLTKHLQKLSAASIGRKILIFSTTFALADYMDHLSEKGIQIRLPKGSRIMETGGYKGRRKEVTRPALVRSVENHLGIPARFVINEYGMTELSSQFYDLSLSKKSAVSIKGIPSWVRVLIMDPVTGKPLAAGKRGLIRIIDLANRDSCLAIQTEDEGRLTGGGLEVLGRRKGADLRGCSLSFEELRGL